MKNLLTISFVFLFGTFALSQGSKLVFEENFDDNSNNWFVGKTKDQKVEIKKGFYYIENLNEEKTTLPFIKLEDLDEQNFTIEIRLRHLSGSEDYNFGIRYGENDYYAMDYYITASRQFKVKEYYNNAFHTKKDWTESDAINKTKKFNVLRVERNASVQKFFINDELVYTCFEKIYFGDKIGVIVSSNIKVEVDYIKLWTSPLNIPTVENPLEDVEFENMGNVINSKYSELTNRLTADGKRIYFTRKETIKGKEVDQIYYTTKDKNGEWKKAVKLPFPINTDRSSGIISISPDNNTIVLTGKRDKKGYVIDYSGICISQRTITGWSIPKNINIKNFENIDGYQEFCMSPDGKVLLMTIQTKESIGQRDIYASFLKGDEWTEPLNLGNVVNSIGDELSPFIAPDGKTLYYSSNGLPGYGSEDVFMAKRLDDTWTNWSQPLNLGKGINSTGWEGYFTVTANGEYGYISKVTNDGFGADDIYKIKLSESAKPEPLVLISGKVLNQKTNNPISTTIKYYELGTDIEIGSATSSPGTGEYQISLPKGKKYSFYAKKDNFYSIEDHLDLIELEEFEEITKNLYLVPIEKGEVIRLNNIFFETGSAVLLSDSYAELDKLVTLLNKNKKLRIKIKGHTDNIGSEADNLVLSKNRAKSVYTYLIEKGITPDRISSDGYGETSPIESNETEEGRSINRRVEFEVL